MTELTAEVELLGLMVAGLGLIAGILWTVRAAHRRLYEKQRAKWIRSIGGGR